jgi:hypothetical protein
MNSQAYFEREISEALNKSKVETKYPNEPNIGVFWFFLSLVLAVFLIFKLRK